MARDDILSRIKAAEADSKAGVQRAMEEKDKKIADATSEAANIVRNAEASAQEYYEKSIAKADSDVKSKKQSIIQSGTKNVDSLRGSANAKLDKAVEYLVKEFMGLLHA
jgi:V/A-type H+/Na+-transporting ATPase subunit G/H